MYGLFYHSKYLRSLYINAQRDVIMYFFQMHNLSLDGISLFMVIQLFLIFTYYGHLGSPCFFYLQTVLDGYSCLFILGSFVNHIAESSYQLWSPELNVYVLKCFIYFAKMASKMVTAIYTALMGYTYLCPAQHWPYKFFKFLTTLDIETIPVCCELT